MMNTVMNTAIKPSTLQISLWILAMIVSGCIKTGSAGTPDSTPPAAKESLLQQKDQESKKVFQQGGQPGLITLAGILVSQDLKLDSHVEIFSESGFGKDGTEASIDKSATSLLSSEAQNTKFPAELRTLITLGCDQNFSEDLAKKRSLDVLKTLPSGNAQKILLSAKTVVLCGKITDLHTTDLTIKADELILNSADVLQTGMGGSISLVANKLFLFGSNIITTQGPDADLILFTAPAITIKVAEQLIADDNARLVVVSKGSSYAESK